MGKVLKTAPAQKVETTETRAEQKARTRARILECALEAFAERGFEGATVRDIAAAAGVNHGLIKYHFGDKDSLWKSAVEFLFIRMHDEISPPEGDDKLPAFEQLKSWIRRYVGYCARHPEHARIMVQESIRDSDRLRWAVDNFIKPDHDSRTLLYDKNLKNGLYPNISRYSITYIIVAVSQYLFMLGHEVKLIYGIDTSDPEVIDAHADAIIELFFNHSVVNAAEPQGLS
jgi:TetR/AcrR family transcriptional regulator